MTAYNIRATEHKRFESAIDANTGPGKIAVTAETNLHGVSKGLKLTKLAGCGWLSDLGLIAYIYTTLVRATVDSPIRPTLTAS